MRKTYMVAMATGAALLSSAALAQNSRPALFTVSLEGEQITRAADEDGSGTARIRIKADRGEVCYTLTARDIDTATAAHIHEGAPGTDGPVVVHFEPPVRGTSTGCVNVGTELATEIATTPGDYYVVVHNAEFPAGAIRGQMGR
jgi:hypothetical protein